MRTQHFVRSFVVWGALVFVFFCGRLLFLLTHWDYLIAEPFRVLEVISVFLQGTKYDSSLAAVVTLPFFLLFSLFTSRSWAFFFQKVYLVLAVLFIWTGLIVDYAFFDYYQDHFNVFFWEFWDNLSNAKLVIDSVLDSFSLKFVLMQLISGWLVFILFSGRVIKSKPYVPKFWEKYPLSGFVVSFIFLLLLVRSTTDRRPLSIQDRKVGVSAHNFLNLAHRNPFFSLYRSYVEKLEFGLIQHQSFSQDEARQLMEETAALIPGAFTTYDEDRKLYHIQRSVPSFVDNVFLKRPKHVVFLFLESYSYWVLKYPDQKFREQLTHELAELIPEGMFFNNHFSSADGTMKNIANVVLGFPLTKNFHPAPVYYAEAYKDFDSKLPNLMRSLGFRTRFFYGSFGAWHNLYNFIPRVGFDEFYAEHSFPDVPHYDYGLYDGDLYHEVHRLLAQSEEATFSFIMSQSNHPPYRVPKSWQNVTMYIPEEVKNKVTVEKENFDNRLRCFKYADYALGEFLRLARTEDYFAETLFVITGDHPFFGMRRSSSDYLTMSKVPLLFYAPAMMRDEYKGKIYDTVSHHIDLVPTLFALLSTETKTIDTWGLNLLEFDKKRSFELNFYVDCFENDCLFDQQLWKKNRGGLSPQEANPVTQKKIERARDVFGLSGLYYLYNF